MGFSITAGNSATLEKCLHGGFKVHAGQRPLFSREPFIWVVAICFER